MLLDKNARLGSFYRNFVLAHPFIKFLKSVFYSLKNWSNWFLIRAFRTFWLFSSSSAEISSWALSFSLAQIYCSAWTYKTIRTGNCTCQTTSWAITASWTVFASIRSRLTEFRLIRSFSTWSRWNWASSAVSSEISETRKGQLRKCFMRPRNSFYELLTAPAQI